MSDTVSTDADQTKPWLFKPGQSGNPAGRPKGSRNALGEVFIEALHKDFNEHGVKAIETVRTEKPDQYLKVIASLLPKDVNLTVNDETSELTDDQLVERIRALSQAIAPFLAGGTGADERTATAQAGGEGAARVH